MKPSVFHKVIVCSGIIGVVILWIGIVSGMIIAHLRLIDKRPISYLGYDPKTTLLFTLTLVLSSILFIFFAILINHIYHIKNNFLAFFIVGQIGQIIAALVSYDIHNKYRIIHTVAAFTLAFSLPLLMRSFKNASLNSNNYSTLQKLFRLELCLFIIGIGLFVFTKGLAPLGEVLPALGFHIWIIYITITLLKNPITKN
ncbi:MAG: hypothetical protein NVSMB46_03850 [Candidatus Saccharimonadales bacterium]